MTYQRASSILAGCLLIGSLLAFAGTVSNARCAENATPTQGTGKLHEKWCKALDDARREFQKTNDRESADFVAKIRSALDQPDGMSPAAQARYHQQIKTRTRELIRHNALGSASLLQSVQRQFFIEPSIYPDAPRPFKRRTGGSPGPDGLVLYMPFDTPAKDGVARDESGAGNNGRVEGATWVPDGRIGGAYQFEITNLTDRIVIPDSDTLALTTLTLSAWIKCPDNYRFYHRIFDKYCRNGFVMCMAAHNLGRLGFSVQNNYGINTEQIVGDGKWHHVAGTFDGQTLRSYVDGVQRASRRFTNPKTIPSSHWDLCIGNTVADDGMGEFLAFNGFIDEVRIYNRALPADAILNLAMTSQAGVSAASTTILSPQVGLAFMDDGAGNLVFNTGEVKGSLKRDGLGAGVKQVTYISPDVRIDNDAFSGLLVPYRFLTPQKRYGVASWGWPRTGKVLDNGAAELRWAGSSDHPFAFSVTYRWKTANTMDATIRFTPEKDLDKFELFVGSYFKNFTKAMIYVKDTGRDSSGFVEAAKDQGEIQLFPQNKEVISLINDGRWLFAPNPMKWVIRQTLEAPLIMRIEPRSGLTALIMAPPEDCFAVSMHEQGAGIGTAYLSLFGKDIKQGKTLVGHARIVLGMNITEAQARQHYQRYRAELGNGDKPESAAEPTSPTSSAKPTSAARIKQVKALFDQGLITNEDYDKKVKEILEAL